MRFFFILPVFAFLSLFFFPWPVSVALLFLSALFIPVSGLLLGVLADVVYYTPEAAFLAWWSLLGVLSLIVSLLVHRFVKTRIME